jgi:hypothetical protein
MKPLFYLVPHPIASGLAYGSCMKAPILPAILLVLAASACDRHPPGNPTAPTLVTVRTVPTVPAVPRLSGTVYEAAADGVRPLAGVGIDASAEYQSFPPTTFTDEKGHYELPLDTGRDLKIIAGKGGYSQPCRAAVATATNGVLDIFLVSNALLATSGVPSSMPVVQPTLSGLVFERTADGSRPIPGAGVIGDFSGGMGWAPSATTLADATGHYMLCGVADVGWGFAVSAGSQGYVPVFDFIDVKATKSFDIELKRQ